jgi:hypothetical protein
LTFGVGGDDGAGAGATAPFAWGAGFAASAPAISTPMMATHPTTRNAVSAIRFDLFIYLLPL